MLDLSNIDMDFTTATNSDLINYIFKRHHSYLKEELDIIADKILTLYSVYFHSDGEFFEQLHSIFSEIKTNFEAHIIKEEKMLYLHIKDYDNNNSKEDLKKINIGIDSVEKNNNDIEYLLNELRRVTKDYNYGIKQHSGYDELYKKLEELEEETKGHFRIERDVVFHRLKQDIIAS